MDKDLGESGVRNNLINRPMQAYDDTFLRKRAGCLLSGLVFCFIISLASLCLGVMLLMKAKESNEGFNQFALQFKELQAKMDRTPEGKIGLIEASEELINSTDAGSGRSDHDHSEHGFVDIDHSDSDHEDHSENDHSKMDHSKMDHDKMDHDKMDRDEMDHDKMDHDKMDHDKLDHDKMDHDSSKIELNPEDDDIYIDLDIDGSGYNDAGDEENDDHSMHDHHKHH